jgi:ABC-type dipeptide/oligopeptide/nickel transport system permease subunit
MNTINLAPENEPEFAPRRVPSALRFPRVLFSLIILVFFVVLAVFAPRIAPIHPTRIDFSVQADLLPIWMRPDNTQPGYWLGTDHWGRDIFSRLVYGSRASIFLALTAAPLAALIGILVGVSAGYAGGRLEILLMRVADIFSAFPAILFSVLMVLILRNRPFGLVMNGLLTLTIAFAAIAWVGLARLLRSVVLQIKQRPFVEAARALGASHWHIIRQHILPNVMGLAAVWIVNAVPAVILLESGLGYLGVEIVRAVEGNEFRISSWGGLFYYGRNRIYSNPFVLLAPTLCVLLISLSFSLLAEYLNQRFNREQNITI